MKKNNFSKFKLYLSLTAFFAFMCFSSLELKAQTTTFDFSPSSFNVVDNTSGGFATLSPTGSNPTYRLFEAQRDRPPGSLFMHHGVSVNMLLPFVFSAKVWYDPYLCQANPHCYPIPNYWGSGFTFSLLSSSARSEVGMRGKYLGYGWNNNLFVDNHLRGGASHLDSSFAVAFIPGTNNHKTSNVNISFLQNGSMTSPFPTKTISIIDSNWYCLDIVWRYRNGLNNDSGFVMEVYWEGNLELSRNFDDYQSLGLTSPNASWGISTGVDTLPVPSYDHLHTAEQRIQFVIMENGSLTQAVTIDLSIHNGHNFSNENLHTEIFGAACDGSNAFDVFMRRNPIIRNKGIICFRSGAIPSGHRIEITGVDDMSYFEWTIDGSELLGPNSKAVKDGDKWVFNLWNWNHLFIGKESVTIVAKAPNQTEDSLVFEFNIISDEVILNKYKEHFEGMEGIEVNNDNNTATVFAKPGILTKIELPKMVEGCSLSLMGYQRILPTVNDTQDTLFFTLDAETFEAIIYLEIDCGYCKNRFTFRIKNENYEPKDICDNLPISIIEPKEIVRQPKGGKCEEFRFAAPGYIVEVVNLQDFENYTPSLTASTFGFKIGCYPPRDDGWAYTIYHSFSYSKTLEVLVKHAITGDTCLLTKKFTCFLSRR